MSRVIGKKACPSCTSKGLDRSQDNLIIYGSPDGEESYYCFACGYTKASTEWKIKNGYINEEEEEIVFPMTDLTQDDWDKLKQQLSLDPRGYRKLKKSTTDVYRVYHEFDDNGNVIKQYYPVSQTVDGVTLFAGVKIRGIPKSFRAEGKNDSTCDVFGRAVFAKSTSKMVVICSGEIDCLSTYQMLNERRTEDTSYPIIPVVSGTIGESGSHNQYKSNYDFFNRFEKIILIPDTDDAGQRAIEKAAQSLPKEKLYIVDLPAKDPTELLEQGRQKDFINAFWKHRYYSPAGIHGSDTIYEAMLENSLKPKLAFPAFLDKLNQITGGGMRQGSIINITAGSGCGKTTLVNQMLLEFILQRTFTIGMLSTESDKGDVGENLVGAFIKKKLQLIVSPEEKYNFLQTDTIKEACDKIFKDDVGHPTFYIIDDRGDFSAIQEKVEKIVIACNVRVFVCDVLSDVMDYLSVDEQAQFLGWQKAMCKRYNLIFINIVHTRKAASGQKGASEGGAISEEQMQGSSAIYKSSSFNIILQRNKMEEDEILRNVIQLNVSKNRWTGITGQIMQLHYDTEQHVLSDFTNSYEAYKKDVLDNSMNTSSKEDIDRAINRF